MTLTAPGTSVPPSPARGLVCRNCGATFGLIAEHACAECFGPLEVDYDPELMRAVTREQIEAGPQNIWRYAALLPVGQDPAERVSLDPGLTPLVRADRLAAELGITGGLWVKDDSANPTHSFKDRVVSMAATAAKGLGYRKIAAASTGNLANSVAAHAARAGIPSFVFIPSDLEPGKVVQSAVYGQTLVGAQSAGCDPIATAFEQGWDVVKPVKPTGIAKSLNIGNPADGPYALDAIRRTGGAVGRVGDDEIVQGIRDLARTTGVFAETAGGVTVAVLRRLIGDGRLDPAKETVVLNTGEGLKTLDPLLPVVGPTHRVEPSLKSARAAGLIS